MLQGSSVAELPHLSDVPDAEELTNEHIENMKPVKKYKEAVSAVFNEGENLQTIENYKQSTLELLLGKKAVSMS